MQLFIENLKMNRKRTKKNYLPGQGFEPQIFSNFPAHEEPEIKSKQGSKRDRTLSRVNCYVMLTTLQSIRCHTI